MVRNPDDPSGPIIFAVVPVDGSQGQSAPNQMAFDRTCSVTGTSGGEPISVALAQVSTIEFTH